MAVMVLLRRKEDIMANTKIVDNNRASKDRLLFKRAFMYRQSGHDYSWIAAKLGMSEVAVKELLTVTF